MGIKSYPPMHGNKLQKNIMKLLNNFITSVELKTTAMLIGYHHFVYGVVVPFETLISQDFINSLDVQTRSKIREIADDYNNGVKDVIADMTKQFGKLPDSTFDEIKHEAMIYLVQPLSECLMTSPTIQAYRLFHDAATKLGLETSKTHYFVVGFKYGTELTNKQATEQLKFQIKKFDKSPMSKIRINRLNKILELKESSNNVSDNKLKTAISAFDSYVAKYPKMFDDTKGKEMKLAHSCACCALVLN